MLCHPIAVDPNYRIEKHKNKHTKERNNDSSVAVRLQYSGQVLIKAKTPQKLQNALQQTLTYITKMDIKNWFTHDSYTTVNVKSSCHKRG
jgi:hypothetical protein